MRHQAIKIGQTVVRDPKSTKPASRSWFKITGKKDDDWVGQNITSRASKRFTPADVLTLIAASDKPHCELDLSALLGKKVHVELAYGKTIGVVTQITTKTTIILGVEVEVPVGISIDGEAIRWPEIRSMKEVE